MEHLEEGGAKVNINNQGHMTKMASMAINSKKPLKIFLSRTRRPIILRLCMKHQAEELFKVYINHDPGVTLTYFTARSTKVTHASEWEKLLKCHLKEKIWTPGAALPRDPDAVYMYIIILFKDLCH